MNSIQYIKNVGKSMGYIAIDSLKAMAPNTAALYDNAKEFSTDLYQTINDFKEKAVGSDTGSIKNKAGALAAETWKNARDDFLSGNWYNKERKSAADDEMMKAMGFDLDFDFDFGDDEDLDDEGSNSADKAAMEQSAKETAEVVGAVNGSVASAANTIASATAKSTEYMVAVQNNNTQALYNLNTQGFNNMNLGLNAINSNLGALLSLGEPLTAHMQNSATYYTKSTELQQKTVSLLEQLVNYTIPKKSGARTNKKSIDDYVGESGINMAAIFTDMKQALSDTVKEFKDLAAMFGGGEGLGKQISASPISMALTRLLPLLMPSTTRKNIKWFDESLKSLGYTGYSKMANKLDNSFLGGILSFFGLELPTNKFTNKYNAGRYEKGKVEWDGKSRKALMEVIPHYLSKMTAIMEGTNDIEIFNYEKGIFETKSKIQTRYKKEFTDLSDSYSYDIRRNMHKSDKSVTKEEISELSTILAMNGGPEFYRLFYMDNDDRYRYIDSVKPLKEYLKSHPNIKKLLFKAAHTSDRDQFNKYDLENMVNDIGDLRGRMTSKKNELEANGGEYAVIHNESRDLKTNGLGLLGISDKYGFTTMDYIRGIYQNTSLGTGRRRGATVSDPLGLSNKIKWEAERVAKAQRQAEERQSAASNVSSNDASSISEEKLKDRFHIKDAAWEEISKESAYVDYLKERYQKEMEGVEPDNNNKIWREIKRIQLTSGAKTFISNLGISDEVGNFFKSITNALDKPTQLIDTVITGFRSMLHNIIFSEKGLMGFLFDKERGIMAKPLKKIKNWAADRFLGEEVEVEDEEETTIPESAAADVVNAYNGRYIRKTGLAAVSEGEIIIPAELNPKYKKRINKYDQIRRENDAISRFYGSFAPGGVVGEEGGTEAPKKKKKKRQGGLVGMASNVLKKGFSDFGTMLYDAFSGFLPSNTEEERKNVINAMKGAIDDIAPHAGDALVGGMIGGGISLLTGAAINPILGAAIGAGTGLIMSSDKVKDFLFGNEKKDKKGLLGDTGKKIRYFMEEQFGETLLGGAAGAVGGALLGHPMLGMFLGSGIAFASKSKGVQNFLFGEKDENGERKGGFISKELQQRFKKALPGMSAGAISGLVATALGGPFGLVGNMLVGAGIGGIVTSEKFKNWMFGEKDENGKRTGGLLQSIRDKVLTPVRQTFFNLAERIRTEVRDATMNFFAGMTDFLKNQLINKDSAFNKATAGIRNVAGKVAQFTGLDRVGRAALSRGRNLIGKAANLVDFRGMAIKATKSNIRRGINARNEDGSLMTAEERLAYMGDEWGEDNTSFEYKSAKALAGIKNNKQLNKFNSIINKIYTEKDPVKRAELLSKYQSDKQYAGLFQNIAGENSIYKQNTMLRRLNDAAKTERQRVGGPVAVGIDSSTLMHEITGNITTIKDAVKEHFDIMKNRNNPEEGAPDDSTNEGREAIADEQKAENAQEAQTRVPDILNEMREENEERDRRMFGADDVANDQESRKGGIMNKLFGEKSIIGKAANIIKKIGDWLWLGGLAIIGTFATGLFDDFFEKLIPHLGKKNGGDDDDEPNLNDDAKARLREQAKGAADTPAGIENWRDWMYGDKKGTVYESKGFEAETLFNYQDKNPMDYEYRRTDVASLSERAQSTLAHQWKTVGKIAMKGLSKVKVGHSNLGEIGGIFISESLDNVFDSAVRGQFYTSMSTRVSHVIEALIDLPFIKNTKAAEGLIALWDKFDDFLTKNLDDIVKKVFKGASKQGVADTLKIIGTVVTVAFIAADFTAGMQDAEVTLQVSNPSVPQRIFSGIFRALKNNIPFVGLALGIIPDSLLFDWLYNTVGKKMGLDELEEQRKQGEEELAQFNLEHGTDYDWGEYVKSSEGLNKRTWTEKAGDQIKTDLWRTKESIKNPLGTLKNAFSSAFSSFKGEDGSLGAKIDAGLASFKETVMPNIIGDFGATITRIHQYASEGKVAELFDANLNAFENDDDPITGFISHFLNPALMGAKLTYAPFAIINRLIYNIRDGFNEISLGDSAVANFFEDQINISGHALAGDIKEMWTYKSEENNKGGALATIFNILNTVQKVIYTPYTAAEWLVKKVWNGLKDIKDSILDIDLGDTLEAGGEFYSKVIHGDFEGLWNSKNIYEGKGGLIEALGNVSMFISKVIYTPPTVVTMVTNKVIDKVTTFADGVKKGFEYLDGQFEKGKDIIENEETGEGYFEVPEPGDDVQFGGLFKTAAYGARFLGLGVQVTKGLVTFIADVLKPYIDKFKDGFDHMKDDRDHIVKLNLKGDWLSGAVYKSTANGNLLIKGLGEVNVYVTKAVMSPIGMFVKLVKDVAEDVSETIEKGKTSFDTLIHTDIPTLSGYAFSGDMTNLWSYETAANANGDSPIFAATNNLILGTMRFPLMVAAAATGIIKDVAETITEHINKGKDAFAAMGTDHDTLVDLAVNPAPGESSAFFDYETSVSEETPMWHGIGKIAVGVQRFALANIMMIKIIADKVGGKIGEVAGKVKSAATFYKSEVDKSEEIFTSDTNLKQKLADIMDVADYEGAPVSGIFKAGVIAGRITMAPITMVKLVGQSVSAIFDNIKAGYERGQTLYNSYMTALDSAYDDDSKSYNDIWSIGEDAKSEFTSGTDPIGGVRYFAFSAAKLLKTGGKFITGFFKDVIDSFKFGDIWNGLKAIAGYKSGDLGGSGSGIAGGASFVSQRDSRYAGMPLGNSSVGAMGCGPAAASMVLGNSMMSNIRAAKKYQTYGGTDISYFGDVFAKNGKHPTYYNLSGGATGTDMVRDIASGKPVVLMGRDPYNTSKAYSPFGPGNHYVVARGFRNGGVVIDDPESSAGGRIYSPSILRNVSAAVSAGASKIRRGRLKGIAGGASIIINNTVDNIWAFFKKLGYADGAVAGILANIQAESSFRTGADNPTDAEGGSHGLCQWNGSRWIALKNRAKAMGRSEFDLTVQLTHIHAEIGNAGAGYQSLNDPYKAGYNFCVYFERPSNADAKGKYRGNLAKEYYSHYTGKTFEYNDSGVPGTPSSPGTGITGPKPLTAAAKFFGVTSSIGSAFSSLFGSELGKFNPINIFQKAITGSDVDSPVLDGIDGTINNDIGVTVFPGKQPVEYMRDVLGKLKYSRTTRDPDKGAGDCSSTVAWALNKAGYNVTTDSRWQYVNQDGTTPSWQNVLWYDGGRHLGNRDLPSLQPNDVVFYGNSTSTYPDGVSHVEMYNGDNQLIGHGSNPGTKIKSVNYNKENIIKIVRPKPLSQIGASGSGLDLSDLRVNGNTAVAMNGRLYTLPQGRRRAAGAAELGSDKTLLLVLKSMVTFVEAIVKNTNNINGIYELLAKYCAGKLDNAAAAAALSEIANTNDDDKIEESLASLKMAVDTILAS